MLKLRFSFLEHTHVGDHCQFWLSYMYNVFRPFFVCLLAPIAIQIIWLSNILPMSVRSYMISDHETFIECYSWKVWSSYQGAHWVLKLGVQCRWMGYNCCFFLNFVPLHIESPYNFGGTCPILGVKNPLQRVNGHAAYTKY